jgi:head-tail adaptor
MAKRTARFRDRVTIRTKNLVDNGRGGRARPMGQPEWLEVAKVFAEVMPLRGDEALQSAVLRSVQLFRVTVRAGAAITTASSLVWNGIELDIKSIAPSGDRRELVMTCESGKPG